VAQTDRFCVGNRGGESDCRPPSLASGVVTVFRSLATFIRRRGARARCEQRNTTSLLDDVDTSAEATRGIEALQQMLLVETMYRRLLERDDEDDQPCSH
jgi:hypothetical protein